MDANMVRFWHLAEFQLEWIRKRMNFCRRKYVFNMFFLYFSKHFLCDRTKLFIDGAISVILFENDTHFGVHVGLPIGI